MGGMDAPPRTPALKRPLSERAAQLLRDEIRAGRWGRELPAERGLARDLGIARSTLRDALAILAREGWVEARGVPARRRIRGPGRRPAGRRRVILLSPFEPDGLPASVLRLADGLRRMLADTDLRLAVRAAPAFRHRRPAAALARVAAAEPEALWVLLQAPAPVHAWFRTSGLPCVVAGECFAGVPLPHVTEDVAAVARHAAGLLRQRGHRRVALLHRDPPRAGHLAAEAAFRAAPDLQLERIGHGGQTDSIARALSRLFSDALPPTALIVTEPAAAVTAVTWMAGRGRRVPEDASIVSLFWDSSLDAVLPAVASYRTERDALPRRLAEVIRALVDGRPLPRLRALIPRYVPGGSLGPARAG